MTEDKLNVVTRFAPSPTGFMHIGGLRTALYAYLWAKKNGGTFVLRIEDTDKAREVPGSVEHIAETLQWLGLDWDSGVGKEMSGANDFFIGNNKSAKQSERLETYRAAAEQLIASGDAYLDPYSAEEVEAFRKQATAEKRPFLFRDHRPSEDKIKEMFAAGEWYGIRPLRFKVRNVKRYTWTDAVRGELTAGEEALDDFILIKADGYPTYNLAHMVDDYHMRVTHVMRADEFISSTPKFLALYEALGYTPPVLVTLPPILRADKTKKLGKRDGAKDVLEYKKEGYLVDAFTNFLAFIGWNPGGEKEIFTREELIQAFDIANIQKAGAVMNEDKLDWYNKEYLKQRCESLETRAEILQEIQARIPQATRDLPQFSEERLQKILPPIFDRINVYADVEKVCLGDVEQQSEVDFFFTSPVWTADTAAMLVGKKATQEEAKEVLAKCKELFESASDTSFGTSDTVKSIVWDYAEVRGRAAVLWPLRVALTGHDKSPDPFTVGWVLGKEECVRRIEAAVTITNV